MTLGLEERPPKRFRCNVLVQLSGYWVVRYITVDVGVWDLGYRVAPNQCTEPGQGMEKRGVGGRAWHFLTRAPNPEEPIQKTASLKVPVGGAHAS